MRLHKGTLLAGLLYLVIGVAFILEALEVWTLHISDLRYIGPIALVVLGVAILIGSIALTKSQRIYENAVLKTLGARRPTLAAILLAEYGILGLLSGLIGGGFAVLLSWAVSRFVMNISWEFEPLLTLVGVVATAVIVMFVGASASFDVLFRKPLQTLRSQ